MSSTESGSSSSSSIRAAIAVSDVAASLYCSIFIVALVLLSLTYSYDDDDVYHYDDAPSARSAGARESPLLVDSKTTSLTGLKQTEMRGFGLLERPCQEIYVVNEGETLQTIGEKCGDPFIVERNPHVQDPDDVFPGLVINIITPVVMKNSRNRRMLYKRI